MHTRAKRHWIMSTIRGSGRVRVRVRVRVKVWSFIDTNNSRVRTADSCFVAKGRG